MKTLHQLMVEITQLTSNMETNYPELYKFLDENPITIPSETHPTIDKDTLINYLETLKQLLKNHVESHKWKMK